MYFVVYLDLLKKNVIIPARWINEIACHFEKFINQSINKNQWHLCYYTTNANAFINGVPDKSYEPDFSIDLVKQINSDGTFDGCFFGLLVHFKGKNT